MSARGYPARNATLVRAGAVTLATVALAACAAVLGIDDERPLRKAGVSSEGGPSDAGEDAAPCVPAPALGCRSCEKLDFCDDFDHDGEAPYASWTGSPLENPFVKRGTVTTEPGGLSAPFSIVTTAVSEGGAAYAIGLQEVDHDALRPGHTFAGVRYAFQLKVEELSFPVASGPVPEAGTAYVGAMLQLLDLKPAGAAILVATEAAYLVVSTDVLGSTGTDEVKRIYEGKILGLATANWIRAEIVLTDREKAIELGYNCADVAPGPVAAAHLALKTYQACIAIPPVFNGLSWAKKPLVGAGVGSFGAANLKVRHDNVMVDFLE